MSPHVTRPVPLQSRSLRVQQLDLTVVTGPDKNKVFSYETEPLLFGTGERCRALLTDDSVSARHCEIARRGEDIVVRDLGSTNGTWIDGVRVFEAVLLPKAKLRLGTTELAVTERGTQVVPLSASAQFGVLFGHSAAMRSLFARLEQVSRSESCLLIQGETGTGKTAAAEAVHQNSARADGPFVVFDCASTSPTLIESELFGHVKGAFTDARTERVGLAESANGGTLVFDEIADLPLELQSRLLRLIENRQLRRLGASESISLDVRIIACTHRRLDEEVAAQRFRQDLFYRLASLDLRIPSLRERLEDLPLLVDRFLAQRNDPRTFAALPEHDQALLLSHDWPGNVRELRNAVERLMAFSDVSFLSAAQTGADVKIQQERRPLLPLSVAREQAQNRFEQTYLQALLEASKGSISEGARLADVSRQFLQRILRKHGLR
jgi:DNA-binding NtrC family response regulator